MSPSPNQWEICPRGKHQLSSRGSIIEVRCGLQRIIFNKAATALFGNSTHLILMRDREQGLVAVHPTADTAQGYGLSRGRSPVQSYITCSAFLKATGLSNSGISPATWDAENERLEWRIAREAVAP